MALVLSGKTICPVCGQVLEDGQQLRAFPALESNEQSPLYQMNDVVFHSGCFASHPLAEQAEKRLAEWEAKRSPGRICRICQTAISHPDDYVAFVHFTDDRGSPLFHWNFEEFHRSCLRQWDELPSIVQELIKLRDSGTWTGTCLDRILERLK